MQTETCNDSDGGTSGSVGHEDHEKHIKKEEAEEEGYVCKLKGHFTAHSMYI